MNELLKNPALYFAIVAIALIVVVALIAGDRSRFVSQSGITSEERAAALAKEGKREQLVSFGSAMVPVPGLPGEGKETAPNLFVIAVGQVTLDDPVARYSGSYRGFRGATYRTQEDDRVIKVDGAFNNLLVFDARTGQSVKVFGKRISITSFTMLRTRSPRALFITTAEKDTNKDGRIDSTDVEQLYAYTLDDGQLRRVPGLDASPEYIFDLGRDDFAVVRAVIDDDNDGSKRVWGSYEDEQPEPRYLYRLDLKTFVATPLIADTLATELQAIIDTPAPPTAAN